MPERTSARASARSRVERLRSHFASADRVLIMMQDDPDPDAIASALALRTHLERGATRADLEAFAYLHPRANHSALRRIERPELPNEALDVLALGIARRQLTHGVVFSHLGPVAYPELVAQFAEFFLQIEGAEWSVVSGTVNGELH